MRTRNASDGSGTEEDGPANQTKNQRSSSTVGFRESAATFPSTNASFHKGYAIFNPAFLLLHSLDKIIALVLFGSGMPTHTISSFSIRQVPKQPPVSSAQGDLALANDYLFALSYIACRG